MGLEIITDKLPTTSITTAGVISAVVWVIFFLIFCIGSGVITFIIMRNKKFNKVILLYENINGRFEPTMKLKAMNINIGDAGDQVLYISKIKKYIPTPSIQTGRNIYYFCIREDGEWFNFGVEDINEKFREMNAWFLDKEMRHTRTALQKNLKERFQKLTFLEKYGGLMVWTALVAIIGVSVFLWFDKMIELTGSVDTVVKASAKVVESSEKLISKLSNVCTGSGIQPA